MKDFHKTILVVFLIVAVVFMISNKGLSKVSTNPRYITVTGDADVMVEPDEVIITIGVESFDKDLNKSKEINDRDAKSVIQLLEKKYKIPKKYVRTHYIRVHPHYENWTTKKISGYSVYKQIELTLKEVDKFEAILTDVLKSGANNINNIQFRTTDLRKHKDQARELALIAAQEKARDMGGALGQTIGLPTNIQENQTGWYFWYNS